MIIFLFVHYFCLYGTYDNGDNVFKNIGIILLLFHFCN